MEIPEQPIEFSHANYFDHFLNNYIEITEKSKQVTGKVNYVSKSILMWSTHNKPQREEETESVFKFHYRLLRNEFSFTKEIKQQLCEVMRDNAVEDHHCEECIIDLDVNDVIIQDED